jgi:hypothetical protein
MYLLGCSAAPSGDPVVGERVEILTGGLGPGCYAGGESGMTGQLVVDPKYGTSFRDRPVMWPDGYTARRAGGEVEVLDADGLVKATTGRTYHISVAPAYGLEPSNAYPAAAECDYPWDFIDCTPAVASTFDRFCRADPTE